jgi:hypothetical protein
VLERVSIASAAPPSDLRADFFTRTRGVASKNLEKICDESEHVRNLVILASDTGERELEFCIAPTSQLTIAKEISPPQLLKIVGVLAWQRILRGCIRILHSYSGSERDGFPLISAQSLSVANSDSQLAFTT